VRLRSPTEAVPLHHPSEPTTLRGADHIYAVAHLENVDQYPLTFRHRIVSAQAELPQVADWRRPRALKMALLSATQPPRFHLIEAQLHGLIAVSIPCLHLRNVARAGLNDGDGNSLTAVIEQLCHSDLLTQDRLHPIPPQRVFFSGPSP
jgi:hypothetical protein